MVQQLAQSYGSGDLTHLDVPLSHGVPSGCLSLHTAISLVSVGTEKAMIDVAQKSLLGKALARPDWVKQVLDKIRTEGLMEAYRQSFARLDMPVPLGYASAGTVIAVGAGVNDVSIGDRVACSGSGFASHAEVASVPRNLCCPVPQGVGFAEASFAALGGIALEAVRMAQVELGHRVVVIGLGLLGQLAVQLLVAAGCHVLGVDVSPTRNQMALAHGAEAVALGGEPAAAVAACQAFTRGHGADSVIILASTSSNEPLALAAELCRERGRVVATGLIGLEVPRKPFYEKELEFVVSRAWGPGLYDVDYEQRDVKYPLPYVRWTAQRNMAEFLDLVALGRVRLERIITHRFPFDRAIEAYEMILEHKEPFMGVILEYSQDTPLEPVTRIDLRQPAAAGQTPTSAAQPGAPARPAQTRKAGIGGRLLSRLTGNGHSAATANNGALVGVGLIGAGIYARGTLLPALQKVPGLQYVGVSTASGLSGRHVGDKFGFHYCTTDYHQLLADPAIQAVIVLTRHNSHARFVGEALRAGKAVFVEKPLALTHEQLADVVRAYDHANNGDGDNGGDGHAPSSLPLMVGFNRRFAPDTIRLRQALATAQRPFLLYLRANAGYIPADSWVHHPEEGGGRIIGEACHFIDLANALTGSVPVRIHATEARTTQNLRDNLTVALELSDGSAATLIYTSTGDKAFPREYVEVFGGGLAGVIDNFKGSRLTQGGKTTRRRALEVDRGHVGELSAFFVAVREGRPQPVPFRDYVATTLATLAIEESITTREPVAIDVDAFIRQSLAAKPPPAVPEEPTS